MPSRVLNPLLALLIPTVGWPWWAIAIQAAFAAIGAELWSTNVALKWLTIGCAVDVGMLLVRSWKLPEKTFSSIVPDVLVRALALYLSWALSKEAAFQFEYKGFSTNPGELLAIFFITIVWSSAGKSSDKLLFPWPKSLMYLLDKVHSSIDDVALADKAISIFTAFTRRQEGDTEIVRKSTTVVTVPVPVVKPGPVEP